LAPPDPASRPLTDFEQVLLGVIDSEPRSGYGLRKMFSSSPSSVYQPSPGALYPALRRLEARGLLRSHTMESKGRRAQCMYHVTDAGHAAHMDWLRQPVVPATVGADLGLHLMRFALMEDRLPGAAIRAFLEDLENALDTFVTAMEYYLASGAQAHKPHAELAIKHGIAVHRASLDWTRSALAALPPAPHPAALVSTCAPGRLGSRAQRAQSKLFFRPSRT
jgi:DNA-binding PadR family transcriptional regulator